MYRFTFFLMIAAACMSCQAGSKSNHEQKADTTKPAENLYDMNVDVVKKYLELQKQPETIYQESEKDVNAALPVIAEGLKANRFNTLAPDAFKDKIRSIFGDVFQAGQCKTKDHEKFVTLLVENDSPEYDYTYDNIYISKEFGFITDVPMLGDFVEFTDSNHYKINLRPVLISRNKYLLNDSKADLAVLLSTDTLFLKTLVTKFGYTKDPKVNELVMNDYLRMDNIHIPTVGELLFSKDCHGALVIREDLLKWIAAHTTENDNRLLIAMTDYADAIYSGDANEVFKKDPSKYFTKEEKRKIVAYAMNTYLPLYYSLAPKSPGDWPTANLAQNFTVTDEGLVEYLKANNYFGQTEVKKELR
jgi:hypothetical protein